MTDKLTRGGQTLFQRIGMFFDVAWKLVAWTVAAFILLTSFFFYLGISPYERYELMKLVEVTPIVWGRWEVNQFITGYGLAPMGVPNGMFKDSYGGRSRKMPDTEIMRRILNPFFINEVEGVLEDSVMRSLTLALLMGVLFVRVLMAIGEDESGLRVVRGAVISSPREVARQVRKKSGKSVISIGGVPLPRNAETRHCLINGSTRSGKTVCLSAIMAQVRKAGLKAIVYDRMGVHTACFHRPGKDIILNPFDKRSRQWVLTDEIRINSDCKSIASSMIPKPSGAEDPFWNLAARELLAASIKYLRRSGRTDNASLVDHLLRADLKAINELLKNTEVGALVAEHAEKTTTSIKSVLTSYISCLKYLPTEGERFSIRDWVEEGDDSWLFITSRTDFHEEVRPLISTWLDIATKAVTGMRDDTERRVYEFIDELPTLQTLPSLSVGMAEGRQFGLCVFITLQSLSQVHCHYGHHAAKVIMDLCGTLVALRSPDPDTAEMISRTLGEREVVEARENHSYGVKNKNREGVSVGKDRRMDRVAIPTEIQKLDDLEAYLKIPGDFPVTRIKLERVEYPITCEPIVLRDGLMEWKARPDATPANNADGRGAVDGSKGEGTGDAPPAGGVASPTHGNEAGDGLVDDADKKKVGDHGGDGVATSVGANEGHGDAAGESKGDAVDDPGEKGDVARQSVTHEDGKLEASRQTMESVDVNHGVIEHDDSSRDHQKKVEKIKPDKEKDVGWG